MDPFKLPEPDYQPKRMRFICARYPGMVGKVGTIIGLHQDGVGLLWRQDKAGPIPGPTWLVHEDDLEPEGETVTKCHCIKGR